MRKQIKHPKALSKAFRLTRLGSAKAKLPFWAMLSAMTALAAAGQNAGAPKFHLEEATINDVHRAIQEGQISCHGLVAAYEARAAAYNGVTNELVTADGKDVPEVPGVVRAGAPLQYPTKTVKISDVLPDFDQYAGPPIEFGRMEPTSTDPTVYQPAAATPAMTSILPPGTTPWSLSCARRARSSMPSRS